MSSQGARWQDRRTGAADAALAALAALAAHVPVLFNGFTNWDDDHYLTLNRLVLRLAPEDLWRLFSSFQLDNYHPLTLLAHAAWHRLFGLAPEAHHALSLALHCANAALVVRLAAALGARRPGALAAGLLFAAHPLHVEVVAWAAQLKTLLATLFFLAALLAYLRRRAAPAPGFPAASLALTVCSLLAKPAAVAAPLLLLLVDRLQGRRLDRERLREKLPFALVALAAGVLTLLAQREALRPAELQPAAHGPLVAAHGVLFLLLKALAPCCLSPFYPYPEPANGGLPAAFLAAPAVLALLTVALWRPLRARPAAAFCACFFLLTLAPALQLVPVGLAHTADRYFYLPSVGLFLLAGFALEEAAAARAGAGARRALAVLLCAIVLCWGALSWRRAGVWRDGASLWADVVARHPSSYLGWGNLAQALAARGDLEEALPAFTRALELAGARRYRAKVHFDRALALQEAGDPAAALSDYEAGLAIDARNARVFINRGNALDALGRPLEALADYERSLALDPGDPLAWHNRGVTHAGLGRHAAAVADFERALALDPDAELARLWRERSVRALGGAGPAR